MQCLYACVGQSIPCPQMAQLSSGSSNVSLACLWCSKMVAPSFSGLKIPAKVSCVASRPVKPLGLARRANNASRLRPAAQLDALAEADELETTELSEADIVAQVICTHVTPNHLRPWEEGVEVSSSSTAFIIDAHNHLLLTTAGAVEHAKKVEVALAAVEGEFDARVVARCLDIDAALLQVDDKEFWECVPEHAELGFGPLPHLRDTVSVPGFALGGDGLAITRGVVSRLEVMQYAHSGRALLAMQVDAALNNGAWGAPALDRHGRCVGMALQKFSSQTWMERYDESLGGGMYDDDDDDSMGGDEYGDSTPPGPQQDDNSSENIAYMVPATLLQRFTTLATHRLGLKYAGDDSVSGSGCSDMHGPETADNRSSVALPRGGQAGPGPGSTSASVSSSGLKGSRRGKVKAPEALEVSLPRLGIRWQRMESTALRHAFGLPLAGAGSSGILITGVDPHGSVADILQVHDVLVSIAGRPIATDGSTPLRPNARERVLFGHWVADGEGQEQLTLGVVRKGQTLTLSVRPQPEPHTFIPVSFGARQPQYLITSGLVFLAFSVPFFYEAMSSGLAGGGGPGSQGAGDVKGKRAQAAAWAQITGTLEWGMPVHGVGEEVVILSEILSLPGEDLPSLDCSGPQRVTHINGERVHSLAHLAQRFVALTTEPLDAAEASISKSGSIAGSRASSSTGAAVAGRRAVRPARATAGAGQQTLHRPVGLKLGSRTGGGVSAEDGLPEAWQIDSKQYASSSPESIRLLLGSGHVLVLERSCVRELTQAVLQHHTISTALSQEMRMALAQVVPAAGSWPFDARGGAGADATRGRMRRQQGRRIAMR